MYSKKDLLKIYRESFSDSEEYVENFFKRYYSHRRTVCVFADGGIVSALYLMHLNTEFYGKQIPAPLIVGAATAKPQRGKGYFKRFFLIRILLLITRTKKTTNGCCYYYICKSVVK